MINHPVGPSQPQNAVVGNTVFPFGPGIYAAKMPDELIAKIMEHALSEARDDASMGLVGNIKREVWITNEFVEENLKEPLLECVQSYLNELSASGRVGPSTPFAYNMSRHDQMKGKTNAPQGDMRTDCRIVNAWVNFTSPGPDFNPPHVHNADLSCVLYLSVPDKMEVIHSDETQWKNNGKTTFLWGNPAPFCTSEFVIGKPQVGQLVLFPANLLHFVMPYSNEKDEKRVTMSANFMLESQLTQPPWQRKYDWELQNPR